MELITDIIPKLKEFIKFMQPSFIVDKLSPLISSILVSLIPYSPFNISIMILIFTIVYFLNPFGIAEKSENYCRYNKLEERSKKSIISSFKRSYFVYLLITIYANYWALTAV